MNSTGAPRASPIAPPSKHPRTRLCRLIWMPIGFSSCWALSLMAFFLWATRRTTALIDPDEVFNRQLRLPVAAVGHQGTTLPSAVIHTDGPVGLQ